MKLALLLCLIALCMATQVSITEIQQLDFEKWLKEYIGAWANIFLFIGIVIPTGLFVLCCLFTVFIICLVTTILLCLRCKQASNQQYQQQMNVPLQNVQQDSLVNV
jgi:hypothetical protein